MAASIRLQCLNGLFMKHWGKPEANSGQQRKEKELVESKCAPWKPLKSLDTLPWSLNMSKLFWTVFWQSSEQLRHDYHASPGKMIWLSYFTRKSLGVGMQSILSFTCEDGHGPSKLTLLGLIDPALDLHIPYFVCFYMHMTHIWISDVCSNLLTPPVTNIRPWALSL